MITSQYFREVISLDSLHVEYVIKETDDKIAIINNYNHRFDVPKPVIKEVCRNVILNTDLN